MQLWSTKCAALASMHKKNRRSTKCASAPIKIAFRGKRRIAQACGTSPRLDLGYGSTWVAGPPTRQTNWTVGNISRANGKGEIELTQHVQDVRHGVISTLISIGIIKRK